MKHCFITITNAKAKTGNTEIICLELSGVLSRNPKLKSRLLATLPAEEILQRLAAFLQINQKAFEDSSVAASTSVYCAKFIIKYSSCFQEA